MLDFGELSRAVEASRIVSGGLGHQSNVEGKTTKAEKAFLNNKEAKVAKFKTPKKISLG